jgi:hypothetical protein
MVNHDLLPRPSDDDAWNRLIGTWADVVTSAIPLARLAWHVIRLFYEYPIYMPAIPSVSVMPVPLPHLNHDPASDYSSEEEITISTASGER